MPDLQIPSFDATQTNTGQVITIASRLTPDLVTLGIQVTGSEEDVRQFADDMKPIIDGIPQNGEPPDNGNGD